MSDIKPPILTSDWIRWAQNLLAIAQNGRTYTKDNYDTERYEAIAGIAREILSAKTEVGIEQLEELLIPEQGYATPKVDVRGGLFIKDRILLVRERSDGRWTVPGGWADVNQSPSSAIEKEMVEESGFVSKAVKLVAVFDRNKHRHPPMLFHVYKMFFLCDLISGAAATSIETDEVSFFSEDNIPALSTPRVTEQQIHMLFRHHRNSALATEFD